MYFARVMGQTEDRVGMLDEARRQMGLNNVQFAAFLGVSYTTWCRWRRAPLECPQLVVIHTDWPVQAIPTDTVTEAGHADA